MVKVVHDNVLGPIELADGLVRIVDTPAFQRLRRLEQLGTASLVFPGARHTRFEHSLGAQEIMWRAVKQLRRTATESAIPCKQEKILRVAALVHDLGHYPLSHVIEHVVNAIETYRVGEVTRLSLEEQSLEGDADPQIDINDDSWWLHIAASGSHVERMSPAHHETVTANILETDEELAQAIEDYIGEDDAVAEVVGVLQKSTREKYKRQLVSSELDVDRLDYLVRDSYYTGVTFGAVEADHIIRRLRLESAPGSDQKLVVVDEKAQPMLEHYLLSRHFMYSQVAYHKAVTAFSVLAGAVWIALHMDKTEKTGVKSIYSAIKDGSYVSFDDTWFWQKVAGLASSPKPFSAKLAQHLLHRRPPALAYVARRRGDARLRQARERFERRRSEFARHSQLCEKHLFLTYQKIEIATELSKRRYNELVERSDYVPDDIPLIRQASGEIVPITGLDGSIAQRLSANEDREEIVRVYCLHKEDLCRSEFRRRLEILNSLCKREFGI